MMESDSWHNSELEPTPLSELAYAWDDLVSGRTRVVAAYATRNRHFLELADYPRDRMCRELDPRCLTFLQLILSGTQQKVAAAQTSRSSATVSGLARRAMLTMGLGCNVRHCPMLLMVMYRTWRALSPMYARSQALNEGLPRVLNIFRPDACLQQRLSPSEYEVARALIDGHRQDEIAHRRRTSKRTVANQLASVYRKLRTSGRNELMVSLAAQDCDSRIEQTTREMHTVARS